MLVVRLYLWYPPPRFSVKQAVAFFYGLAGGVNSDMVWPYRLLTINIYCKTINMMLL